jgi:hypothetical protein
LNFFYRAFGLVIESQIECPELISVAGQPLPDVLVRCGATPGHLDDAVALGGWVEGRHTDILLKIRQVANYLIHGGREITVHAFENASPGDVRLYLLGSAMGAVLHQRGVLPFHGSSVCIDGRHAVTFSGPSGIGKSTLAAALLSKGYRMLADDVSAITFGKSGIPFVNPGMPQIKLCGNVFRQLGRSISDAQPVGKDTGKYACSEHAAFVGDPLVSKTIYILGRHSENRFDNIVLKGMDKFHALRVNTYRPLFVKAMGMELAHFDLLRKLAGHTGVCMLLRPDGGFRLDELTDYVSHLIAE